jgi:hypothetical protein
MWRSATLFLLVVISACGSAGLGSQAAASGHGAATATRTIPTTTVPAGGTALAQLAVVISGLEADAPSYVLSIVDPNGRVLATTTATNPDHAAAPWQPLPLVSTSASRAYYLDGTSTVRFLRPDGTGGVVTQLPNQAGERAVFAVSPDDSRIGVSVFNVTSGMRLYTAALSSAPVWHQIFATTAFSEWPIGWRANQLVLGLGYVRGGQQECVECAWRPIGIHLADPDTGLPTGTLCDSLTNTASPSSAPTAAGVLCTMKTGPATIGPSTATTTAVVHWDGSAGTAIPSASELGVCPLQGALSPNGMLIATTRDISDCSTGPSVNLFDTAGHGRVTAGLGGYRQMLWIDDRTLCYSTDDDKSSILDISTGRVSAIGGPGLCLAVIPGGFGG